MFFQQYPPAFLKAFCYYLAHIKVSQAPLVFSLSPRINNFSKEPWFLLFEEIKYLLRNKKLDPRFIHYYWGVIPFSHSQWTLVGNMHNNPHIYWYLRYQTKPKPTEFILAFSFLYLWEPSSCYLKHLPIQFEYTHKAVSELLIYAPVRNTFTD